MTSFTKGNVPVGDVERSRNVLQKIRNLESFSSVLIDEDSIEEFFEKDKIRRVPLFLESLKNYYNESEASISRANVKAYSDLKFARDDDGVLVAYVYKSKLIKPKSPTDVMLDRWSN